ncbi:MAG: NADH-quinone oxidoreductase subunit L [Methanomassiliicoccaceae archaeon]|jgi:NADH-quinone oxidoreductase subunit L|nr:NADH-quinone oxidoreductase subunit L [Methanomassiliicoccaceae archaeon]
MVFGISFMEYAWLIPLFPVIAFVVVGFFGNKFKEGGGAIAIGSAVIAFALSALVAYEFFTGSGDAFAPEPFKWLAFGKYELNFGIYIDSLTCIMMLFASFISLLIFIYSIGYMHGEGKRKRRYYAEIALFLAGMLGLVLSSNYFEMFIFWEIMGVCSYLLIGFWAFRHPEGDEASVKAASAAKKAFLVTRLGDVCFMAGLFVLLWAFTSLDFTVLFDPANMATVDTGVIMLGALLLFGGVIGKSAQFPLQDWLPDAMAGPTTVSALIHAATMVKAGVYLVARSYPLFIQSAEVMLVVALIGGITAFIAATMALNNMNLKRVLAYSTISQLGYMILALGAGGYIIATEMAHGDVEATVGYTAGVFHMMNHAFFKALLFMCAGSVIHAVGTEDMRRMGGLSKKMRITSLTMLIGCLSIAGFPFLSGFWSKDMILEAVMEPSSLGLEGQIFMLLFVLALITAFMTAFYMFRLWFLTFKGKPRDASIHCHGESPKSMTMPLMILSVFAVGSGFLIFLGLNDIITFSVISGDFVVGGHGHTPGHILDAILTNVWTYVSLAVALIGILLAYLIYARGSLDPSRLTASGKSRLYRFLAARYFFPQLYDQISWKLGYSVAKGVDYVDKNMIDGTVNGLANSVVGSSGSLRKMQTGNVRDYLMYMAVGLISAVIVLYVLVTTGGL